MNFRLPFAAAVWIFYWAGRISRGTPEDMDYSVRRLLQVFPRRFSAPEDAAPYAHAPESAANFLYDGRYGNIPGTDDGWRYRGRRPIQVTGRANYRAVGFEDNPEAVETPYGGAQASTAWWENNQLPARTASELDRQAFDRVTRRVNAGASNADARWEAYQRALGVPGR